MNVIYDTIACLEYESRIGRKLTEEELKAFRLVGKLKSEADRDFSVKVHFHKGQVKIETSTGVAYEYEDFDDGMQNYVNDEYHLADIVHRALRLERIGLCEIRDYINEEKKNRSK